MFEKEKRDWVISETGLKLVIKPWGFGVIDGVEDVGEIWLNYKRGEEVGDEEKPYVFKKLFIKKETMTSFQYHDRKIETNFLISGQAEAWLENEAGEIEKSLYEAGESMSVPAGRKHRLIAITDMVMLEASTPEVDDVHRVDDEFGRTGGRIQDEHKN